MTADTGPLVTVVVPVFNRVESLLHALASIQAQTYPRWEAIVVDDASTVDVQAAVSGLGDTRIRYVRRRANGGVAAAQNDGLDHAHGRYVAFLHSDDEMYAAKLATQVRALQGNPSSVAADETGLEVCWPDRTEHWAPSLTNASPIDLLAYRRRVHIAGLLIDRDVAARVRFDHLLRGAEDRDFCVRLLAETDVSATNEALARVSKTGARLAHQDKSGAYRHLLHKYASIIERDRNVHADWWYRISRAHARAGDLRSARDALRHSLRLAPARARRWPLLLSTLGGSRLARAGFLTQVRAAEYREGAGPRRQRGEADR